MFRFNRAFFIISNFFLSIIVFLLIFMVRYSWIHFEGVVKKELTLITILYFFAYSVAITLFNIALKIYEINKISKMTESIILNYSISLLSIGLFGFYFYLTQANFARLVFFLGFILVPPVLTIYNKIFFIILSLRKEPTRILYFGTKINYTLFEELMEKYSRWFKMDVHHLFDDITENELLNSLKNCDLLVVDTDHKYGPHFLSILNSYEIEGGKIYSLIDMFSYFDQSLPAEIISNNHYDLFSSYKIESLYSRIIKRIGDIFISLLFLVILSPLMIITMILVKISSPGPVFYVQKRTTRKNKVFNMYKFRSMRKSAESSGVKLAQKNDVRVTLIGKIIRPLRIDETPQLINILFGHMSFIGPRPERPELIEKIIEKYPLFKKRLLIKPGLTGWAQVKFTYVSDIEDMNKKLSYDLFYIKNLSFIFDVKIMLYTIETVIFRRGAV